MSSFKINDNIIKETTFSFMANSKDYVEALVYLKTGEVMHYKNIPFLLYAKLIEEFSDTDKGKLYLNHIAGKYSEKKVI